MRMTSTPRMTARMRVRTRLPAGSGGGRVRSLARIQPSRASVKSVRLRGAGAGARGWRGGADARDGGKAGGGGPRTSAGWPGGCGQCSCPVAPLARRCARRRARGRWHRPSLPAWRSPPPAAKRARQSATAAAPRRKRPRGARCGQLPRSGRPGPRGRPARDWREAHLDSGQRLDFEAVHHLVHAPNLAQHVLDPQRPAHLGQILPVRLRRGSPRKG